MEVLGVGGKIASTGGKLLKPPLMAETQEKTIDVAANGTYTVEPDSGKLLSKVTVNTSVPSKPEQTKSVTITRNGTTTVTPDSGYTLSSVALNVQVASGTSGAYVGSYTLSDGILQFNVPQEDYENYRNYYIKKSDVPFGLFLVNIALGTQADTWMVTHETSSSITFSSDYVATSLETPYYKFMISLADSGAQYYDGGVEVYVITA